MERMKMSISKTIKTKPLEVQKTNIATLYHSHVMEALHQKGKTWMKTRMGRTFLWLKNPKNMATSGHHNMSLSSLGRNYYIGITKEHNKW
jgi:hypothetical protein